MWSILEGIEWKHLPDPGGLLDQDQALMQDLSTIGHMSWLVEATLKSDGKIGIVNKDG